MAVPDLRQLYEAHQGNVSDKWSLYLAAYGEILQPLRHSVRSVLEIGVQNGGSLELWAGYFDGAQAIVGCDIDPACAEIGFSDPRISMIIGDASEAATRELVLAVAPSLDVIIDDGSHKSEDIIRSLVHFFPALNDRGIYIVEDLHCSYWQSYQGGLHYRLSAMSFLKCLADVLNREHWTVPEDVPAYLRPFCVHYHIDVPSAFFTTLHSVEFRNSMAILRKRPAVANLLGDRVVVGATAAVAPSVLEKGLTHSAPPPDAPRTDPELAGARKALQTAMEKLAACDQPGSKPSPLAGQLLTALAEQSGFLQEATIGPRERIAVQRILTDRALAHPAVQARIREAELSLAEAVEATRAEREHRESVQEALSSCKAELSSREAKTAALETRVDKMCRQTRELETALQRHTGQVTHLSGQLQALQNSRSWRYTRFLRVLLDWITAGGKAQ